MPYQDMFVLFWKELEKSVQEGNFAKLTMSKTIGKLELKNIFVRPIYNDDGFKVLLKHRYRLRETEDEEVELTLEEAFNVVKSHLKNPFSVVIIFTTAKDINFKINKKGIATITETPPTFRSVIQAKSDV
ncbi:hypothetical protein [Aurantibacter sp.]|uniref:hypothetical protein n=1 Tax=Aurantibacter sp. TaxID=2807103 RepID=UPI0035C794BD